MILWTVLGLVVLQRLGELVLARRNTRRLLARGASEVGAGHYPLFIALHAGWLAAIPLFAEPSRPPIWPLLGLYLALQLARVWVIAALGPFWTTRVITLPGAPLIRRGPYRFVRHPNYWIVAMEIAVLPLAFHLVWIAALFSALNAALLVHRVRVEARALASRP